MHNRIQKNKLHLLKDILLHEETDYGSTLDEKTIAVIKKNIELATSVSEVWHVLFRECLFDLYFSLKEAGISPTANEMNEVSTSNHIVAWYTLALSKQGLKEFKALQKQGIWATHQALAIYHAEDKLNTLQLLLKNKMGKKLYEKILNFDQPNTDFLHRYIWSLLITEPIDRESNLELLRFFIDQKLYPPAKYLDTYWNEIVNYEKQFIYELVWNGVVPKSEQLSDQSWVALAECYGPLEALLKHNVLPSKDIQSTAIFWTKLLKKNSTTIIEILIDKDRLPHKDILDGNSWRGLSECDDWNKEKFEIFVKLFDKILKNNFQNSDLAKFNECVSNDSILSQSVWSNLLCRLLNNSEGKESVEQGARIFLELCQSGYLPSQEVLDANTKHGSIWSTLLRKRIWPQLKAMSILKILFDNDCLPSNEALLAEYEDKALDSYYDFDRGPQTTVLAELNKLDDKLPRVKNIQVLVEDYHINFDNRLAAYLTRDEALSIYRFLFCYYSLQRKKNESGLPPELWLKIASFLLPQAVVGDSLTFHEFVNDDKTISTFAKYHTINALDKYYQQPPFWNNHKDRAKSLKEAIKASDDPRDILAKQGLMSHRVNKTPYAKPIEKYETPFQNVADENFDTILREGCLLGRKV